MKRFILLLSIIALAFTLYAGKSNLHPGNDEESRKKITNEILNNLVSEKYDDVRKDFHSSLKAGLPAEKIAEVWKSTIDVNGPFEKVLSTTMATVQGFNQVKLRCKFKNENATLEATFTEDDRVIGLYIKP
ncbi:DUF3887 domain-containing protein [Chitinophaga agrisoli]|uniref:DUF3887 domain-containing protein n=1 Tax=Chitinophaga agrisoli TaxID=2607653 RepID=A0A5B2VKP5_9BACT|nr:DUF3887 domain-containing protein [Chitinophaga agrisoli]KAA2238827.1 DUF3887 domain-containing protein [Chitinophaga agrisoli]